MDKDTLDLFKEYAKHTISIEQYLSTVEGAEKYRDYLCSERGDVMSGMIKWPDDDNPDNWASAWPGNYVAFSLYDRSSEKLFTPVEIHKRKLEYVEHSRYYYPNDIFNRLGWDDRYWMVEVNGQECSRSKMTNAELLLVYGEITPEERMESDIKKAAYIGSYGEDHPHNQISTLHPYRLRLFGTDDCSYTYFFNDETAFHGAYIIANPCWSLMNNKFVFTN